MSGLCPPEFIQNYHKARLILKIVFYLQHEDKFSEIIQAVKGSPNEKRLASQFIARFFKHFPKLSDTAMDAMLDLCEDDDVAVS